MGTTLHTLKRWWEEGVAEGATHMIVVTDTFDWEDYPVFVLTGQDPREVGKKYDGENMQKITEVYKFSLGWESQSKENRSFHWEVDDSPTEA